ncbi:hypothetical protein [Paenibacillus sp. 1P07SE]|uniref:hypothetical protein n=1 Tax=Paenibacillus sp. 1P07SE TaxID=3132209 RepID=UPI0039A4C51E
MKSLSKIMYLISIVVLMAGCSKEATPSFRTNTPPLPVVTANSKEISPIVQSSYCWKTVCADYAGGKTMVEGQPVTPVEPGETINIQFDYKPIPTQVSLIEFTETKPVQLPLDNGTFKAPSERGTYYYGISANWLSEDGKYSIGDTSSVFAIEVRNVYAADEIKGAIKAEGIELTLKEEKNDWILNKVKPQNYSAVNPVEKTVHPEHIAIYMPVQKLTDIRTRKNIIEGERKDAS